MAVGLIADALNWRADVLVQVGVGNYHQEVDVLTEEWPGLKVIGFEPHPDIFKGLGGSYPGTVYKIAISDYVGQATLYGKRRHKDGSSIYPHTSPNEREKYVEHAVEVGTLDLYFSRPDDRVLLWLDCEGAELAALRGGEQFVKGVQVVNVELTANPPGDQWCDPLEAHRWLAERGFYNIHIHTHRIAAGQWDGVYVRKELFDPAYCCVPTETLRFEEENK